jgi:hypothetical protein
MTLATGELGKAREAASALLETLELDAYLFVVEPREETWELKVECAISQGWQTVVVPVDIRELLASRTDPEARARLAQNWNARLGACLRRARGPQ